MEEGRRQSLILEIAPSRIVAAEVAAIAIAEARIARVIRIGEISTPNTANLPVVGPTRSRVISVHRFLASAVRLAAAPCESIVER
jgi:hypothetical protein